MLSPPPPPPPPRRAQQLGAGRGAGDAACDGAGGRGQAGSEEFLALEAVGADAIAEAGFVLVAGGLGERLGYQGIKASLPAPRRGGSCAAARRGGR